jgi:hypothetical protein
MPAVQVFTNPSLTELRYKNLRFLITNSPDDENVPAFIEVRMQLEYDSDRFSYGFVACISDRHV